MTTKDIEEIKGEFRMLVPDDDGSAMDWLENILTTLNQKHAEELEKAVEAERERIYAMIESLPAFTCCSDKCMGKVSDEAKKPMWGTNYLEREAVLQALTPTKTDKTTEV